MTTKPALMASSAWTGIAIATAVTSARLPGQRDQALSERLAFAFDLSHPLHFVCAYLADLRGMRSAYQLPPRPIQRQPRSACDLRACLHLRRGKGGR